MTFESVAPVAPGQPVIVGEGGIECLFTSRGFLLPRASVDDADLHGLAEDPDDGGGDSDAADDEALSINLAVN